jgi:glutamate 5-kinase
MKRDSIKFKNKIIVIKLGTNAVTLNEGGADKNKLIKIVEDVATLIDRGFKIILVSSGAIHTARGSFHLKSRDIVTQQALSAIGQPELMHIYNDLFSAHGLKCGQVLLTHEDFKNRTRFFNAQKTLLKLLDLSVIPILNENDTVSFSEITVGDNDHLAAMVSQMLKADLLLILTTARGLYNKDPSEDGAYIISEVKFEDDLSFIKTMTKTEHGRGGMHSKLEAIKKVTPQGISVILSSFLENNPIQTALEEKVGTFFHSNKLYNDKKGWLLATVKPNCAISVDEGAYKALNKGASLLPSGIVKIEGTFKRGDSILIKFKNKKIGFGTVEYDGKEIEKLKGLKVKDIELRLGYKSSDEIIHRDNLVIKEI